MFEPANINVSLLELSKSNFSQYEPIFLEWASIAFPKTPEVSSRLDRVAEDRSNDDWLASYHRQVVGTYTLPIVSFSQITSLDFSYRLYDKYFAQMLTFAGQKKDWIIQIKLFLSD